LITEEVIKPSLDRANRRWLDQERYKNYLQAMKKYGE
jgi:hypothetical protein